MQALISCKSRLPLKASCHLWHSSRTRPSYIWMEEVQVMQCKRQFTNPRSNTLFRRLWGAFFAGLLLIACPAAAANAGDAAVNKLALNAYCSEAHEKAASLADGSISYKQVADLASHRASAEHPNVYPDPAPWKTKIAAILDQYGDEPMSELCAENPVPRS